MTIANLGISVSSGQAQTAAVDLDKLTASARTAEVAADALGAESREVAVAMGQVSAAAHVEAAANTKVTATTRMHTAALQAEAAAMRLGNHQRANLIFQLNDIGVSLASGMNPLMVAIQQGSQISTIYGPGEGGIGKAFAETGKIAAGLASRLTPIGLIIGALTAGFAAMTTEINRNAETQVSMIDVLVASWQLVSEQIIGALQPVIDWFAGFWDTISPYINTGMNVLIGMFDIAFRNIKTIWMGLPAALGDVTYQAAQSVVTGITWMVNEAIVSFNILIASANGVLAKMGAPQLPKAGLMEYPTIENPFAGADSDLSAQLRKNGEDVRSLSLNGGYTAMIGDRAQDLAAAKTELEGIGGAANAANDNVKNLANDGMASLGEKTNEVVASLQDFFQGLGSSIWQTIREGGNVAEGVLDSLSKKLDEIIGKLLDDVINQGLASLFGGFGGGGGGLWNIPSSFVPGGFFPGFATGGDFTVGGSGGTDSQVRALRLTPGEQVSIRRPDQAAANSNQPQQVNINVNVDGARGDAHIVELVRAGVSQGIGQYDRTQAPQTAVRSVQQFQARNG